MINTNISPPSTPIESPASDAFDPGAFAYIPLTALSRETHLQLSKLLNMKKILRSEDGYERDYRGIGMLAELRGLYDESTGNMDKVLHLWCSIQPITATFGKLEEFLGKIDRWDVSDDIHENLVKDANNYNAKQLQKSAALANTTTHGQTNGNSSFDYDATDAGRNDDDWSSDPNILTRDDVLRAQQNLPLQQYDAFVLFAKEDVEYATQMLVLENDYNFKLCLKDRDLLAGVEFMHVALPQLIEERCKYLIAILSEQFFKSPENKFLVNFTQAHQIEENRRKIIPVRFGNVIIPRTLSILTYLTYQQSSRFYDFWDRLADSIRHGRGPVQQVNVKNTNAIAATTVEAKRTTTTAPVTAITKTAAQVRLTRSNNTQLNLSNLQTQASTPTSPTPTQTPSPAISDIPSISINGHEFVLDDDEQTCASMPTSPLDKPGNGALHGLRRSVTIGAHMFSSAADLTTLKQQQQQQQQQHQQQQQQLQQKQHLQAPNTKSTFYTRSQTERGGLTGGEKYKKRLPLPRFSKLLPKLRHAHSTSQLSAEVNMCERTTSFSDLSTNSGVSEPKKKKKWSHKLKRIFSRSNNKLQETA